MHPDELMNAALRVLTAIDRGRALNGADLQILRRNAQPDERALSVHELAGEVIRRVIAKRRTLRTKH